IAALIALMLASSSARDHPARVTEKSKTSGSKGCRRAWTSPRCCETPFCTRLKRRLPVASAGVSASPRPPWHEMHGPGIAFGPGAELDRVGADVPAAVAHDRRIEVEGRVRVRGSRLDEVVLDVERHRLVEVLAHVHPPSVAQVAAVAEDHVPLVARARLETVL